MASLRIKLTVAAVVGLLGAGGWFLHSVSAAQAQGALAQAPLNDQVQVPPAFIMAVDDSNSMTFERIFPGGDGRLQWNSTNNSFFKNDGSFYNVGSTCQERDRRGNLVNYADCYLYLFPHSGYNGSYSIGLALPPLDSFGFARSHQYNAGYFNPAITYEPWRRANGTLWPNASITSARADPRDSSYGSSFSTAYGVTYDLTSNRAMTTEYFRMIDGMRIPDLSGTGVRHRICQGGRNCTWTWSTSARTISGNEDIQFDYFPATFYLKEGEPAPQGYRIGDSYRPLVNNACGPGCNMRRYQIKPGNYSNTADYDAAIQNFANWFQYGRSRLLAMTGALSHSMAEVENMRVGYFTIGNRVDVTMHDVATNRQGLFDQFYRLQAGGLAFGSGFGGTPNRDAVAHLGAQFARTNSGAPIQRSCQRNGGMLFTDGFTNSGTGPTGIGNVDRYLDAPFADNYSDTIPDIVSRYYLNTADGGLAPLRTGTGFASGNVPVPDACWLNKEARILDPDADPRLDCQINLHMNFYGITLGARGNIYDVNLAATEDPFTEHPNWNAFGNPRDSDGAETIDEIWHGTINTRGDFVNAQTPADITEAMRKILRAVSSGASPSGTLALTGSRINSRSLVVQPSYEVRNEGTDWFSHLTAYKLGIDSATRDVTETEIWEASDRLGSQSLATRRAHTWYGTPTGASLLTSATLGMLCNNDRPGMSLCTASQITDLGVDAAQAVDYLLGDSTREVIRNPSGTLRYRSTGLGDIVNSTPVVSAPTDDYGYRSLGVIGGVDYGSTYSTYVDTTKESRPAMVYVGANDGMLRAFHGGIDASGTVNSVSGGRQQFAYVPRAVLGHMGNLLFPHNESGNAQKFQHRYFVDGPLTVSDAHFGGGWKTVLVGTTGAGGRSVFGLNVTNPTSFNSSSRLWEIDDQHPDAVVASNIGHVLGRPVIVPVRSGSSAPEWKAIFGNGYSSESGVAALFVVDIATGDVSVIRAVESGAPSGSNGLGNIVVTDQKVSTTGFSGRDGFADTVYAADQKGAVWKFDLSSTTTLTRPLFTTQVGSDGYRQPIIGGLVATAGVGNGVMLFFGTGSFSFYDDASDSSIQAIYAVNDRGQTTTMTGANLTPLTVVAGGEGSTTRTITGGGLVSRDGWYLPLPAGERAVGYPRVASGVLFIPTYAPRVADGCSTSGFNWLYGLNTRTGGPALESVRFGSTTGPTQGAGVGAVALETGGTAPVKEVGLTVLSRAAPPNLGESGPSDNGCWIRISVAGQEDGMYVPYPCGRQSWRQLQ